MKHGGLLIVVLFIGVLALGSCGEDSPVADGPKNGGGEPPPPEGIPDTAVVSVQLVSWADPSGHSPDPVPPAVP